MINLLKSSNKLLSDVGYFVRLTKLNSLEVLEFEGTSIVGFCSIFNSTQEMIENWKEREETIYDYYRTKFQGDEAKLWNAYSVFLCSGNANKIQKKQVEIISQNIELTRKIAGCEIRSNLLLKNILLPILPFQFLPTIDIRSFNENYEMRIKNISRDIFNPISVSGVETKKIVKLLGEMS